MAAGNVPDGISHGQNRESKREGHTEEPDS